MNAALCRDVNLRSGILMRASCLVIRLHRGPNQDPIWPVILIFDVLLLILAKRTQYPGLLVSPPAAPRGVEGRQSGAVSAGLKLKPWLALRRDRSKSPSVPVLYPPPPPRPNTSDRASTISSTAPSAAKGASASIMALRIAGTSSPSRSGDEVDIDSTRSASLSIGTR